MPITFNIEHKEFRLQKRTILKQWIRMICESYNTKIGTLNYMFCTDEAILEANVSFLNHSYYTDIITFDTSEEDTPNDTICGDLLISVDTVRLNAEFYKNTFEQELYRVMIHGILHLIGFDDLDEKDQKIMRGEEDKALSILTNLL